MNNQHISDKQIRAFYSEDSIRVYQAYSDEIADSAIEHNTFVSPPFKMSRMTWIKPSFLWMMYRAGWGHKDSKQKRILAIDITHQGFHWALENSCLSSAPAAHLNNEQWKAKITTSPVRIQWDPERDIHLNKLPHRAIQIGLSGEAVELYTKQWIVNITDVTDIAQKIKNCIDYNLISDATALLPKETPYVITNDLLAKSVGISNQ